ERHAETESPLSPRGFAGFGPADRFADQHWRSAWRQNARAGLAQLADSSGRAAHSGSQERWSGRQQRRGVGLEPDRRGVRADYPGGEQGAGPGRLMSPAASGEGGNLEVIERQFGINHQRRTPL